MNKPQSVAGLTELGRVRLSEHFFMREMLYSEVASFHGLANIPEDPELAIETGKQLCRLILEPLCKAFGRIVIRSAYRSPAVNDFCHRRSKQDDVLIPWYLDEYRKHGDFRPLAWWIRDHIADYAELIFFPWQCTFNVRWYEGPSQRSIYKDKGSEDVLLTRLGMASFETDYSDRYRGFPTL